MATITFKGSPVHTVGELPKVGSKLSAQQKDVVLVGGDLSDLKLGAVAGKRLVNIFPSLDTGVCAASVRAFHKDAAKLPGVTVVNVSLDLPFAHKRFCTAEGIEGVKTGSGFRTDFGTVFGVTMTDGPLRGLYSRAVVVVDENDVVKHVEQVPEIAQEPNYKAALEALK